MLSTEMRCLVGALLFTSCKSNQFSSGVIDFPDLFVCLLRMENLSFYMWEC